MRTIIDPLVAVVCIVVIIAFIKSPGRYSLTARIGWIAGLAVVGSAHLIDLIWHTHWALMLAFAVCCLIMEIMVVLTPSDGSPRSYVRTLKIGWAMTFLGACLSSVFQMRLFASSTLLPPVSMVLSLGGLILLASAYLRPQKAT